MELRTASSNSMGPGMSSAACGGWLDIFFGGSGTLFLISLISFLTSLTSAFTSSTFLGNMRLPCSSSMRAVRSVEKGVFNSRNGFASKCLEIWVRREPARERGDAMLGRGCRRLFTARNRKRGAANIRYSETCDEDPQIWDARRWTRTVLQCGSRNGTQSVRDAQGMLTSQTREIIY